MNYLVNGNRAEPLVPMSGLVFDHTIDSTNEPWDVFDISVPPSTAKTWIAFGLTITGCAIAGAATGVFLAAVVGKKAAMFGKRVFDAVTS